MSYITPSIIWKSGAVFTALGMSAGAFGSHGLKSSRPDISPQSISSWSTASSYLIYNGLALFAISLHPSLSLPGSSSSSIKPSSIESLPRMKGLIRFSAPAIVVGGLLFSGSIFALVLDRERFKGMGPVTPLGGLVMIAGYIALAF